MDFGFVSEDLYVRRLASSAVLTLLALRLVLTLLLLHVRTDFLLGAKVFVDLTPPVRSIRIVFCFQSFCTAMV